MIYLEKRLTIWKPLFPHFIPSQFLWPKVSLHASSLLPIPCQGVWHHPAHQCCPVIWWVLSLLILCRNSHVRSSLSSILPPFLALAVAKSWCFRQPVPTENILAYTYMALYMEERLLGMNFDLFSICGDRLMPDEYQYTKQWINCACS